MHKTPSTVLGIHMAYPTQINSKYNITEYSGIILYTFLSPGSGQGKIFLYSMFNTSIISLLSHKEI